MQANLTEEVLRRTGFTEADSVHPHTLLSAPDQHAAVVGEGLYGRMGNRSARTEHQERQDRAGYLNRALGVVDGD